MKIKDMYEAERPREKMLALGAGALSTGELIAILLRNGYGGVSALDISQNLLSRFDGSLTEISRQGATELSEIPGIKSDKACSICAALELGKRFIEEQSNCKATPIVGAEMVYRMMKPLLKGLMHEECWIILLNKANYILKKIKVTSGGLDATVIDVGQITRIALSVGASAVILVHNHPSGNPRPSKADLVQTKLLRDAVNAVQVGLLDHVIVCDDSYFSFSAQSGTRR